MIIVVCFSKKIVLFFLWVFFFIFLRILKAMMHSGLARVVAGPIFGNLKPRAAFGSGLKQGAAVALGGGGGFGPGFGLLIIGASLYTGNRIMDQKFSSGLADKDFEALRAETRSNEGSTTSGSHDILVQRLSLAVRGASRFNLWMTTKKSDEATEKLVATGEDEKVWWLGQPRRRDSMTKRPWFHHRGMFSNIISNNNTQPWGMARCIRSPGSAIDMSAATGLFICTAPESATHFTQTWKVIVPSAEIDSVRIAISVVSTPSKS
jgi:hypothetical protein